MKKFYHILFFVTLLIAGACGYGMLHVRVNSDMTKYLPDSSPMAEGVGIIMHEFPGTDINMATIELMFHGDSTQTEISNRLKQIPGNTSVSSRVSEPNENGVYTLYTVLMQGDAHLIPLARDLHREYPAAIIETSQDGTTPPISAIVIAALLVGIVLLVMAQSWLDPVLYLLTIGVAVLINMGSNALLPSVSETTNYIVAILQMVLSLDYSIILVNRYRQEMEAEGGNVEQLVPALGRAIRRAYPSILSSSLTTIVGLTMLCFMRLKIGFDLGIVLGKGVLCCLICTFTVMPSFILLFHKAMERTRKPSAVIPTDRMAIFAARYKYPIVASALVLFGVTYLFSQRTNIYFCTSSEGEIAKVFPKTNPMVLLYSTDEEQDVIPMADKLLTRDYVQQIVSYPTLLKRPYTAEQMNSYFRTLQNDFKEYMPGNMDLSMMTPDLMRLLYYMRSGAGDSLQVSFSNLMHLINDDCLTNPLFEKFISDSIRSQSAMLQQVLLAMEDTVVESLALSERASDLGKGCPKGGIGASSPSTPRSLARAVKRTQPDSAELIPTKIWSQIKALDEPEDPEATNADGSPVVRAVDTLDVVVEEVAEVNTMRDDSIPISEFMARYAEFKPDGRTEYLRNITDTALLYMPMTASELSALVGSTEAQTKMALRMAGKKGLVTPLEYVHTLADDLFLRPGMVGMVSKKQKAEFARVVRFMDLADRQAVMNIDEISALLADDYHPETRDTIRLIAGIPIPLTEEEILVAKMEESKDSLSMMKHVLPASTPWISTVYVDAPDVVLDPTAMPELEVEEEDEFDQAQFFTELMTGDKTFSAAEMAQNFTKLGYALDEATLHLLYAYYGHKFYYDTLLTMSPEELLNYAVDTLLENPVIGSYLDEESRTMIAKGRSSMDDALGMIRGEKHSLMAILTTLPSESEQTYTFIDSLRMRADEIFEHPYYVVGESAMYDEMKRGFHAELARISWLTILAIFLIVAFTFKSVIIPVILIIVVMTAVYVDVIFSGIMSGGMLYLAYLISQSILMGATIDYGILFTNYYRENRKQNISKARSARNAYRGSIRTIMTSGTIMTLAPGAMAMLVNDVTISSIVMCIAIGACAALLLILLVVPGTLDVFDRWVIGKENK